MNLPILLALLLVATATDSLTSPELRRPTSTSYLTTSGKMVETDGRSFATAKITLERVHEPGADPYAVYMSVGPIGAEVPQESTQSADMTIRLEPPRRRLRVSIRTCENSTSFTIDEILTGRADSRQLVARYRFITAGGLWDATRKAKRVLGPDPTGEPITWISPTQFAWTTRSDTLVFEQQVDSLFTVTLRPRIR